MKKTSIGYFIIASAIIWGAVIIGCAYLLRGTEFKDGVVQVLAAGAGCHLLFIWGPLAAWIARPENKNPE